MAKNPSNPALTYTIDDFIKMQTTDQLTFRNFSILENVNGYELLDHNLVDDYDEQLNEICIKCKLTTDQYKRYRYFPDLLAYDVYGSTQLDFIVMHCNGIIDPKEFDFTTVNLPYGNKLKNILSAIYNANAYYAANNKYMNGFKNNII